MAERTGIQLLPDGRLRAARPGVGFAYDVTVKLKRVSYALSAGQRLRVAVSSSYWPSC